MGTQTEKVLGTIGAMQTLIENFPMSIIDYNRPTDIKCAFDFILKILAVCGVDVKEIINRLLESVFGVKTKIEGGIEDIYQTISDLDIDEQSSFMKSLEYAVKGILMALLTSIFSCSALPIIPDKYLDTGKIDPKFTDAMRQVIRDWEPKLRFPTKSFDLFGMLDVNPFSNEGQLYYKVEGGDVFYQKKETFTTQTLDPTVDEYQYMTMPTVALYLDFGEGHYEYENKTNDLIHGTGDENEFLSDYLILKLSEPVNSDVHVVISYFITGPTDNYLPGQQQFEITIPRGSTESESFEFTPLNIGYRSQNAITQSLVDISIRSTSALTDGWMINGLHNEGYPTSQCIAGNQFVYLDKDKSKQVSNFWLSRDNATMSMFLLEKSGSEFGSPELKRELTETDYVTTSSFFYERMEKRPSSNDTAPVRYTGVPISATPNSPKYIVVHEGLIENDLYKTSDMNAFLWYVLHKSRPYPQIEKNKNVWDSRNYAKTMGIERNNPMLWNLWYNSKTDQNKEFELWDPNNPDIPFYSKESQNRILYPIMQCNRVYPGSSELMVEIAAQKYYKPDAKLSDNDFTYKFLRTNKTIYEFNWEYLNNIQIFKPKLILFGMFDAVMNGAISTVMGIKPNFKKEEIKAKLSNAIIKYINALDTETEDCYFTFTNDEFNQMLEDMLLSKYNATIGKGEIKTVKQHNITDYFNNINEINTSAQQEGSIEAIMKTITDVSATKGTDVSIDYGFDLGYDESWWKQIVEALALSVIESILTPQVVLLILINFQIMGVTSAEDLMVPDQAKIVSLVINKLFGLVKSIISFIKDKILEILLDFVYEKIIPMIGEYVILINLEKIQAWIDLLTDALNCLMTINIGIKKQFNQLDEVNYADIETPQIIPESTKTC